MNKILCWCLGCLLGCAVFAAPLPTEQIFQLKSKWLDANTFLLEWTIKPNYFLYQERIKLTTEPHANVHLGQLNLPAALPHRNQQGHTELVYRHKLHLPVYILGLEAGESILQVAYQGCSDRGFCYPPQQALLRLSIDQHHALQAVNIEATQAAVLSTGRIKQITLNPPNEFQHVFTDHHWSVTLVLFFGCGLLLAFTPCILPMVPVLSGIILGQGQNLTHKQAGLLSLTYVLGMSVMYAIVGAVVALMGNNLQILMQTKWAIGGLSLIFILLALSMFDLYQLRLPLTWQAKFANFSKLKHHGRYVHALLMGCFSTLVLSPCVTPPLIGALAYIAQTGSIYFGSLALFFLGLGMGTPLLLVGLSAGKLLPKAGMWMNTIKAIFGILLMATAIYLLQRILPATLSMVLWSLLGIFSGIFLGAFQRANDHHQRLRQGIAICLFVYGVLVLIGISQGHDDPLTPLKNNPERIPVVTSLDEVEQVLHASSKPVLLDFYAGWCASCKHMATTILQNAEVKQALAAVTLITVDLTANDHKAQQLLQHFKVVAPPTFVCLNQQGQEIAPLRLIGNINQTSFLAQVAQCAKS